MLDAVLKQKPELGFGGVWIGNTVYSDRDAESGSVNVGYFFWTKWSPDSNIYKGYAISTNHSLNLIQDDYYEEDDDGYAYIDRDLLIEETSHIPVEYNLAYILRVPFISLGIGGGVSMHSVSTYLSYELTSQDFDPSDDTIGELFCTGGLGAKSNHYLFGGQILMSAEYQFGASATFIQAKYQYVQDLKLELEGEMTCSYYDYKTDKEETKTRKIKEKTELKLSSMSYVVGITYHF